MFMEEFMKEYIHTIENDQYGNEIKRVTRYKDFTEIILRQYNDRNDLISETKLNEKNETLQEDYYEYNYDELDNKTNVIHVHKAFGIVDHLMELVFTNEYDANNNLLKSICYDQDRNAIYQQIFTYKAGMLEKKLEYKAPFTKVYRTSCYQHNKNQELVSKHVYNDCEEISYYIKYILLQNGRYNKSLKSPSQGDYRWVLDTIESDSCYIEAKEPTLSPDMFCDICDYILRQFPYIHNTIIFISESEDVTYHNELDRLIMTYKEEFGLHISFDL